MDRARIAEDQDGRRPLLVLLHFLGGSAREWSGVTARLDRSLRCIAVDLPGFGDAAGTTNYSVAGMADVVARVIEAEAPRRWIVAGHSMGAKVAAALARRAEDGSAALRGLSQIVLLAGSPPCPEPMDDSRRAEMLSWFAGDAVRSRAEAEMFIDRNSGAPLGAAMRRQAVDDVLRMQRAAWTAWLEHGSREDWSDRIGVLRTPALILAGGQDGDLGPDAQARLMRPHFDDARLATLAGAGHLLPMERPDEVAALMADHAGLGLNAEPVMDPAYRDLIGSERVSSRTRTILLERARPVDPDGPPGALPPGAMAALRAVMDRVLPQPAGARIDLAARVAQVLASGEGDGWRFAELPPDLEAYAAGLRTLDALAHAAHGRAFADLDGVRQDRVLSRLGEEPAAPGDPGLLSPHQMRLWFEDVRADAVRVFVAHPATLGRLGYSGIANGGDGARKQGFVRVGADDREAWEPVAPTGLAP